MAERRGDVEGLAVLGNRQARRHALVFLGLFAIFRVGLRQKFLAVGIVEDRLLREQARGVVEAVNPVVETAAGEEPLAVGRPDQAGETGGE